MINNCQETIKVRSSYYLCTCQRLILFDFYFTLLLLVLCRVAAVKSLPVHHHSAGYILFPLGSLSPSGYFENRIPLKPVLEWGEGEGAAYAASQTTVLLMKRLNQTESLIFVILCILCFQRQSFYFY